MSTSFCNVNLMGRLGKDPESKVNKSGELTCKFTLAVANKSKKKEEEGEEETKDSNTADWYTITARGREAAQCVEYLKKGRLVSIVGKLSFFYVKDPEKMIPVVTAYHVEFVDSPSS